MRTMLSFIALAAMIAMPAMGQPLAGKALTDALRQGGYVLVIRHANSPAMRPDKTTADPQNPGLERQLDATGRDTARAMGAAFKTLRLPIAAIWSSPSFRARQTIALAALAMPKTSPELDEGAAGMAANAEKARAEYLRSKANEAPAAGTDTLIVSHAPNIMSAFGRDAANIAAGEAMVFKPGATGPVLIARVKIEDWPKLAAAG